jgi:hypothetical protein
MAAPLIRLARPDETVKIMAGDDHPQAMRAGDWAASLAEGAAPGQSAADEVRIVVAEIEGEIVGSMVMEMFDEPAYEAGTDSYMGPYVVDDEEDDLAHAVVSSAWIEPQWRHDHGVWPAMTQYLRDLRMPIYGSFTNFELLERVERDFAPVKPADLPPVLSAFDDQPHAPEAGADEGLGL